jgi:hypothetical protein
MLRMQSRVQLCDYFCVPWSSPLRTTVGAVRDRITPIASDLLESQPVIDVDGVTTREGLPAPDCDIDIARIDFESAGLPADPFGREQRRARAAEGVEHDVVAVGAVFDRIGDERDRLHRRVRAQVVHAAGAKRVGAGVFPDIGAGAAVAAEFDSVEVRGTSDAKHANLDNLVAQITRNRARDDPRGCGTPDP